MPTWADSAAVRIVIVVATMLGMLLSSAGVSAAHRAAVAAAEPTLYAERPAAGRGHEDAAVYERTSGQSHGHEANDHSHDTPSVLVGVASMIPPAGRDWHRTSPAHADPKTGSRLDRPPRPILAA